VDVESEVSILAAVLVEEVSMVNDDAEDNCFLPEDKVGRFPDIEEDKKPRYLLCTELPGTKKFDELVETYLKQYDTLVLNTSVVDIRGSDFSFVDDLAGLGGVARLKTGDKPGFPQARIREWIEGGRAAAGGPGNCAPLMSRAGLKVAVGANLGRGDYTTSDGELRLDAQGKFFYDTLIENGVAVEGISVRSDLPTGTAFIHEPGAGDRGAIVYYPDANDVFSFRKAKSAVRKLAPKIVYYMYSGLSAKGDANRGRDLAGFIRWCGQRDIVTIVDSHTLTSNPREVIRSGKPVSEYKLLVPLLPEVDIFFTSSEEARMIANTLDYLGLKGAHGTEHEFNLKFIDSLMARNFQKNNRTKLFGLTVSDGAYFSAAGPDKAIAKARKIKSRYLAGKNVDLVGAGDAFRAGLLTYIVRHLDEFRNGSMSFAKAVQMGNLFAALYIKAPLKDRYGNIRPCQSMIGIVESGRRYRTLAGLKSALRSA